MQIDLSGKTALITGGNIGIGRGIALALAESGAAVATTYLSHEGDDTAAEIRSRGGTAHSARLDATDSGAVNATFARLATLLGGHVDILVNNAGGLVERAPIAEMSDELWR